MSAQSRPSNNAGESTKERLLAIACKQFLKAGERGLSMRNIAKEAGLTPMAIYRHFDNKEVLQCALLAEAFRQFMDHLIPAMKGRDARQRLNMTVEGYFEFAACQPAYFELIFLSINPMNNLKAREIIQREARPTFRFLYQRVCDCIEEGYFRPGNPFTMSLTLLAQSTGIAALYLSRTFDWNEAEARKFQQEVVAQTLTGLLNTSQKDRYPNLSEGY